MTTYNDGVQSSGTTAPLLEVVQRLQFTDRPQAEMLLRDFINETFPDLAVEKLELRPQATSLNSFNGFLDLSDGRKLFFKTHVEQDNQISEYYNAQLLADAGYPVIQPLYSSTHSGQQLLIYKVITDPPVFDIARELERNQTPDEDLLCVLTEAQHQADDHLYGLYRQSFSHQTAEQAASAPIHQLFYHRLTGGRLDRFYGTDARITLPNGEQHSLSDIRQIHWTINGSVYSDTLDTTIQRATTLLYPAQAGHSIIGHGDAHNGNVFLNVQKQHLTYFDPAFAGRHHPLLDLTKPLFHNVFAMWMYFPQQEHEQLKISLRNASRDSQWQVEHNYGLNQLRRMFLESKIERVLIPIMQYMKDQNHLPENWRLFLKAALFCCPFLTMDLKSFPPEIALLGLTMAVEMGADSHNQRSVIDTMLDVVEHHL